MTQTEQGTATRYTIHTTGGDALYTGYSFNYAAMVLASATEDEEAYASATNGDIHNPGQSKAVEIAAAAEKAQAEDAAETAQFLAEDWRFDSDNQ